MQKVLLDVNFSKKLSEQGSFIPKHCYDNVYNNLNILVNEDFLELDFKVMFAYVSVSKLKNVYTRHACFYINGKAVDPTVFNIYKERVTEYDVHYLPIKIMTINEYLILLSREGRTDLFKTLSKVEEIKHKDYFVDGAICIG